MIFLRKTHVKTLAALVLVCAAGLGGCANSNGSNNNLGRLLLEAKAKDGDPESQFIIGGRSLIGSFRDSKNCALALDYLEKSANQNYALAESVLAGEYYSGNNCVKQDYKKAFSLYQRSAEKGIVKSQIKLAEMYEKGQGVKKDIPKAKQWYEVAANQGNAIAQYQLGLLYYKSTGSFQDHNKAFHWVSLSANQGHILAEELLIEMYEKGQGVTQNMEEAAKWREKTKKNKLRKMVDTLRDNKKE